MRPDLPGRRTRVALLGAPVPGAAPVGTALASAALAATLATVAACAPDTTPAPEPWPDVADEADTTADAGTDPGADPDDAHAEVDLDPDAVDDAGCPEGRTPCDGLCVDTETHPVHCGACDTPCDPGPGQAAACVANTCERWCAPGFADLTDAPGCETACTPTVPLDEVCDGLDNDCDGRVDGDDEGFAPAICPLTDGACAAVVAPCTDGDATCDAAWYTAANDAATPRGERRCDGVDNDCDGRIDEACCDGPLALAEAPTPPGDAAVWASQPVGVVAVDGAPHLVFVADRQRRDEAFETIVAWAPLTASGDPDTDAEVVPEPAQVRDVALTDDGVAWLLVDDGVRATTVGGAGAVAAAVSDASAPAPGVDRLRAARVDDDVWLLTGPGAAGRAAAVQLRRVRDRAVVQTVDAGPPGARPVALGVVGDRVVVVTRAVSDVDVDAVVVRWFDRSMTEQATTSAESFDSDGALRVGYGPGALYVTVRDATSTRIVTIDDSTATITPVGSYGVATAGVTADGRLLAVVGEPGDLDLRSPAPGDDAVRGRATGVDVEPWFVTTAGGRTWLLATVGDGDTTARAIALSDEGAPLCDPDDTGALAE